MAKITITESQFKSICRNLLKESRKADYVKNIVKESLSKLNNGLEYETLDPSEIDNFLGYDRTVAQCHIDNVGGIIVYPGTMEPIDDEYALDEIYSEIERGH